MTEIQLLHGILGYLHTERRRLDDILSARNNVNVKAEYDELIRIIAKYDNLLIVEKDRQG